MAAADVTALRVGLCGRAARVELRQDEGLSELRTRVADAFGLTAPFDLINPQGVPMRTDMDTLGRGGGVVSEVTVDAGEEVLLDLERAHEETGAIRWVMLRKVLAGLRRQLAEAHAGLADAQHRAAVLDEQLVCERSSREAGDAAASGDLRDSAQRLDEEINRSRREAQAALEKSVAELNRSFADSLAQAEATRSEELHAIKQELQAEREERKKMDDEATQGSQSIHAALKTEEEVRAKELHQVCDSISAAQENVERERCERLTFQDRITTETVELGVKLTEEQAKREHDLTGMHDTLGKARADLKDEGISREKALEAVYEHIKQAAAEAEAQLTKHQEQLESRLADLSNLQGEMHQLADKERQQREVNIGEMTKSIEEVRSSISSEAAVRKLLEETLQKTIAEATAAAEAGRSSLDAKLIQHETEFASVRDLIQQGDQSRLNESVSVRKDYELLREDVEKCRKENQELCTAVSTEETQKREEGMEEMRRMHTAHGEEQREWAKLLIDQLFRDLRADHEAQANDQRRRGEEVAHEAAEKVKVLVMSEVSRIETSAAELIRAQEAALREDKARRETDAQHTACEVRDCLTSHSDFMEALEREQQILINRLNEGLALEDQKRDSLGNRIHGVELDMQKVRGHLPILFATPAAFR